MGFVTREYAINQLRKNGIKYWQLFAEGGSCIGDMQDEGAELEESITELEEALDAYSGGWVEIRANLKKKKELAVGGDTTKGSYKFKISLGSRDNNRDRGNGGGNGGGGFNWMEKYFDEKAKREKAELENMFEKKIAELSGDSSDKFLDRIGKLMELEYLNSGTTKKAVISDKPETAKKETEKNVSGMNNKEKVLDALSKLNDVSETPADDLLKLAKFAKDNPDKYKQYISML